MTSSHFQNWGDCATLGSTFSRRSDIGMSAIKETGREAKKIETRLKLIDAAQRLFSTHPYDEVKVEDITREAGTAKGTFFNYFKTKEEIVSEMKMLHYFQALMPLLDESGPIVPKMKRVLVELMTKDAKSKTLLRASLSTKLKDYQSHANDSGQKAHFLAEMRKLIDRAKENKEIHATFDSGVVIQLIEQFHLGAVMQ
jgi:AcrR family transcriptional regulator